MVSRSVDRCTAVGTFVLFVLTVINVLALDHTAWHVAADETHALHCHGEPASCAGSPVPSGPGQFLYTEPGAAAPEFIVSSLRDAGRSAAEGLDPRPQAPPPRT